MSIARMAEVWKLDLPTSPKMVLLALADCANDDGTCWPSMATIAAKASMSLRTAQGCIKTLVEGGFLERDERAGKGCFYNVLPRRNCTPAKSAPPQKTTRTPADSADKPSRTIIDDKAKASSSKRAAARRDAGGDERAKRKAKLAAAKAAWVLPLWADPQVWADFLMIREGKLKAQAFTATAYLGVIRRCEQFGAELGQPPGEILRECVERGWAGIFNPMESDNGGSDRARQNRTGRRGGGSGFGNQPVEGFARALREARNADAAFADAPLENAIICRRG
jgi:hypothetical protein